ncbi:uncharacterized protein LOC144749330 [Ciona intestinalis]
MNAYKLIEYERNHACKISVSTDGKRVTSDGVTFDPSEAFKDMSEVEEPISAIQRSMKPVMHDNTDVSDVTKRCSLHVPTFISVEGNAISDNGGVTSQRLAVLRRRALDGGQDNNALLKERTDDPTQVKWQLLPLLEARIFHCEAAVLTE